MEGKISVPILKNTGKIVSQNLGQKFSQRACAFPLLAYPTQEAHEEREGIGQDHVWHLLIGTPWSTHVQLIFPVQHNLVNIVLKCRHK